MLNVDSRVDAYIAKSGTFAQPILLYIRELVHANCSEVNETIKWGMPHFTYKNKNLCHMAAFKAHCALGFWQSEHLPIRNKASDSAMGQFGKITTIKDLPSKTELKKLVRAAVRLIDENKPSRPRSKVANRKPLEIPTILTAALKKNKKAGVAFESLSYSHQREYTEWISEAKREATREKRVNQAIEMLKEGKSRNWKYMK